MSRYIFFGTGTLFFCIISILFFNYDRFIIGYELDPSYVWATNYFAFGENLIGNIPIFSYGPLGFLIQPAIYKYSILLGFFFELYCNLSLFYLSDKLLNKKIPVRPLLIFIICFESILIFPIDLRIVLLCYLLVLEAYKNFKIIKFLHIFLLVFALIFMKSTFIFLLLSLFPIWIYLFIKREFKISLTVVPILSFLLILLVVMVTFNYSLIDFYNLFRGYLELSFANSSAMTYADNGSTKWTLFFLYISLASFLWIFLKETTYPFFFPSFLIANFIFLKYAMARSDHASIFFFLGLVFFFIFCIYVFNIESENWKWKTLLIFGYLISLILLNFFILGTPSKIYLKEQITEIKNKHLIFKHNDKISSNSERSSATTEKPQNTVFIKNQFLSFFDLVSKQNHTSLRMDLLPEEFIKEIGNKSVDIYPYEVARVLSAGLNWKNRPVYQSYITSSEWLIEQNIKFFNDTNRAPEYLIFHSLNKKLLTIDSRYLPHDELRTILLLRDIYEPTILKDGFLLLRKRSEIIKPAIWKDELVIQSNVISPLVFGNEEMNRFAKESICIGSFQLKKSLLGTLKRFFYKEEPIYISYEFGDSARTFRYIPDLGESGLLVYPFLDSAEDLYDFFARKQRTFLIPNKISMQLTNNKSFYQENYTVTVKCAK
ncbi:MAG: hypothetical protein KBA66_07675 [Leptospiraceae bacterium]|nr:hypothetical protein [Leptospiraceae bacterium]